MNQTNHQAFLKQFFGQGNALDWGDYTSGSMAANAKDALKPWIDRISSGTRPYFLPRVDSSTKLTTWYAFCNDAREARGLKELLIAFVGSTYSYFNGQLAILNPNDPLEVAVKSEFGDLVFKLPVLDGKYRPIVAKKLSLLVSFNDRTPNRTESTPKPIGRLLRDLEMAIVVKNEQSAWTLYEEIKSRGRLSSSNLSFLQVTIYAAFERWQDILSLPQLDDLMRVARPNRVSDAIATAVYQTYLQSFEELVDAEGVVSKFKSLNRRFDAIFRTTSGFTRAPALKAALVAAVSSDPQRSEQAAKLTAKPALDGFAPWCRTLLNLLNAHEVETPPEQTQEEQAETSFADGDFDNALSLFLDCEPSHKLVRRVLEIAIEINTLEAASSAVAYFESSSQKIKQSVESRRVCRNQLEELSQLIFDEEPGQASIIASWPDWFRFVDSGSDLGSAVEIAKQHCKEWNCQTILDSEADISELADLIKVSREGIPRECVRNAVPHLVDSFLIENVAQRSGKPIYLALTDVLIYDETIGTDDLTAVEQLVEAVLTSAPSHEEGNNDYQNSAEFLEYLWESVGSSRNLDWALGMLDMLIDTGAANHTNLDALYSNIIDSIRPWKRRVNDEQWSFLEFLGQDLGLADYLDGIKPSPPESDESEEVDISGLLEGQSIAVFSLTERIAKRFGQMAAAMFKGIKLHYVHDKSLTDRMKSLAKSVDIFIVNTWDAKHAATNGIKDNRPANLVTLEPDGKSSSSLLRTLKRYVESIE